MVSTFAPSSSGVPGEPVGDHDPLQRVVDFLGIGLHEYQGLVAVVDKGTERNLDDVGGQR